jgi:hypothetical protein
MTKTLASPLLLPSRAEVMIAEEILCIVCVPYVYCMCVPSPELLSRFHWGSMLKDVKPVQF